MTEHLTNLRSKWDPVHKSMVAIMIILVGLGIAAVAYWHDASNQAHRALRAEKQRTALVVAYQNEQSKVVAKGGTPGPSAARVIRSAVDGRPGPAGPAGARGRNGVDGEDGNNGAAGAAGSAGLDGKNGINGDPGLSGLPGNDGAPGIPGVNGTDGADGADGAPGVQGAQGIPGMSPSSFTFTVSGHQFRCIPDPPDTPTFTCAAYSPPTPSSGATK